MTGQLVSSFDPPALPSLNAGAVLEGAQSLGIEYGIRAGTCSATVSVAAGTCDAVQEGACTLGKRTSEIAAIHGVLTSPMQIEGDHILVPNGDGSGLGGR